MVQRARSTWMLLHINSSDFEDAQSKNAPEFFGDPLACSDSDVVAQTFKQGSAAFNLQLQPSELSTKPTMGAPAPPPPPALQPATLTLAVPSCPKPTDPSLIFGTVEDCFRFFLNFLWGCSNSGIWIVTYCKVTVEIPSTNRTLVSIPWTLATALVQPMHMFLPWMPLPMPRFPVMRMVSSTTAPCATSERQIFQELR